MTTTVASTHSHNSDPTDLTTKAIEREFSIVQRDLQAVKESIQNDLENRKENRQRESDFQEKLFSTKVEGIQNSFEVQIKAINDATNLRLAAIHEIPDSITKEISHHEDLQKERFAGITQQFNERDIRTAQAQEASAQALAAALQAAKELVGAQGEASAAAAVKSETSFTKQIDQIGTIIQTLEKALDARITELKERIDRGEGNSSGVEKTQIRADDQANAVLLAALNHRNEGRANIGQIVGISVAAMTFVGLVVAVIALLINRNL